MNGFFKKIILLAIIVTLATGLFYFYKYKSSKPVNKNRTDVIKRADLIKKISFAGKVISNKYSIIAAPYNGYINKIYVTIGQKIQKNDPLVQINLSLETYEQNQPLRAPFSGIVTLIRKNTGEFVKENDLNNYIMRIDDMSSFMIEAKIAEIDRGKIIIGQEALIKIASVSQETFLGSVTSIALAPEEKSDTFSFGGKSIVEYTATIAINKKDDRFKPGFSAIIDVITDTALNTLVIGHEFIYQEDNKYYVILKDFSKKFVTIGLQNDSHVEIIGLNEGDIVQQVESLE